jgi:hypothetical protein
MRAGSTIVAIAISACVSSLGASAFAQKGSKTAAHDGDQIYIMDADQLNGDVGSPYGATLKVRPPPKRALLIRPRASFVQEMLKSVENI